MSRESFRTADAFMATTVSDVTACLHEGLKSEDTKSDIIDVMKNLSKKGFVEMDEKNPIGKLLVKHNVAGYIIAPSLAPDINPKARKDFQGLAAALQMNRIAIARILNDK